MTRDIHVETDRSFTPTEYAELMAAVHGCDPAAYPESSVTTALSAYHFVGHIRDAAGMLVGHACAYSDGVFATLVGEIVVHPRAQGGRLGAALLDAVEATWPGVPVFALGFADSLGFYAACGYTRPPRPVEVLTKLDTWPPRADIVLEAGPG